MKRRMAIACFLALLVGCASGPEYTRPSLDLPMGWAVQAPWRVAKPDDAAFSGSWWQRFGDRELDELEARALANNATLAVSNARLMQARSVLTSTAASALPLVGLGERVSRQRISADRPLTNYSSPNFSTVQNELSVAMTVSYELDLAGRVQQSIASAKATLEQSSADYENTRLLLAADLATNYFNLREIDAELRVLGHSINLQKRSLELMRARHELGAATGLELAQQQTILDSTLVQVELLQRQRGQFEHAVATLVGVPAPQFALPATQSESVVPAVPVGMPSDLLERRPDVAASERAMAVANAQIGIANAAFYPSITLGSVAGVDSREFKTLFDAPSMLWSIGLSAAQTLFDGGKMQANLEFSRSGYTASVANYRRVVLVAMQEVEDGITGLTALGRASRQAGMALNGARKVLEMTTARYDGGASTYAEVIAAQQAALASERQSVQLQGQQLVTTVFLIKALGGDWQSSAGAKIAIKD